jgi:hypothetical protein
MGDPLVGSVVLRPGRVHARALDSAWAVAFDVEMRALCPVSPYLHRHNLYLYIYRYICINEHDQDLDAGARGCLWNLERECLKSRMSGDADMGAASECWTASI